MEFRDRDFSFRAGPDVPNLVRNDLRVLLWDFRAVVHEKAYEGNPEAFGALWESVKVDVYRGVFEWVLQQGFFELRLAYTRAPSLGDNEISDLVIQLMPEIIDADMLEGFMRARYPLGTPRPPSAAAAFADAMASRFIRIRNATDPL